MCRSNLKRKSKYVSKKKKRGKLQEELVGEDSASSPEDEDLAR